MALVRRGEIPGIKMGSRWMFAVVEIDRWLKRKPQARQCRACLSKNTYRRRFKALDDQDDPALIACRQCRECGEIRVIARPKTLPRPRG